MSTTVFTGTNISKKYRETLALQDVSIDIQQGEIYGLIGQNGAGKSTLMRIIAGLTFMSSGNMSLFGEQTSRNMQKGRCKIGCMIETPGIFPSMTAEDNLMYYQKLNGLADKEKISGILKLVGLELTGRKKAKNFSLGMKQRLGIAIALLNEPEFLILDEPINGLDPTGVVEIRNLLQKLNQEEGMTILISSHNLPELYQVATRYIIIDKGKVIQNIDHQELEKQSRQYLQVQCSDSKKLQNFIAENFSREQYQIESDESVRIFDTEDRDAEISQQITNAGLVLITFVRKEETLEQYFLKLIGGEQS